MATSTLKYKIHDNAELLEQLKLSYRYDSETGRFIRLRNTRHGEKGTLAGRISKRGYRELSVNSHRYREHRLAWLWITGDLPLDNNGKPAQIDHIDGDRTNNREANLRLSTQLKNSKNMMLRPNNTSGTCGVVRSGSYVNGDERWTAQIKVNYKNKFLGNFRSKEEAIAARKAADIAYGFDETHGEYREKNHISSTPK